MTISPEVEDELEAALVPLRARFPGITNDIAVQHLPPHLRGPLWQRAVGRYLEAALAEVEARPAPKPIETVTTILDAETCS